MEIDPMAGVDTARLDTLCLRYGIAALFVFGSVARGTSAPTSDVDLLYELRPGARLGWEIEDLSDALAEIFGRPVDLVARTALRPSLRASVLGEARPVYAAWPAPTARDDRASPGLVTTHRQQRGGRSQSRHA